MKKKTLIAPILSGAIILLFLSSSLKVAQSKTLPDYVIPDTPETKKVIKAVEKAYDIESEAAFAFDLRKFPDVFINDPRFPVSPSTLETVRELTGNPTLETAGYLDYKMAYYSWRIGSTMDAEKIKEKAKQENRSLTSEEAKSLVDENGRSAPAPSQSPLRKKPLNFLSVAINDDIATVILDDGPWTLEMYLVNVEKRWYVAGVKGLAFHP